MRPATAPEISAGVITANMPRNAMVKSCLAPSPSSPIPLRNAAPNPPKKAASKLPPAIEYPTTTHRIGMIRRHQKFIISMFRTFLLRSMPP